MSQFVSEIEEIKRRLAEIERHESASWFLIYQDTLTGNAKFDFASIPQHYNHLKIWLYAKATDTPEYSQVYMFLNGDTTATNYYHRADGAAITNNPQVGFVSGGGADAGTYGLIEISIPRYSQSHIHVVQAQEAFAGLISNFSQRHTAYRWQTTAAINRIQLQPSDSSKNFISGSQMSVFAS